MSEMDIREQVIRECIAHLQGRPGRNAIRSLKGMLVAEVERQKPNKPAADHPWRKTENAT